MTEKLTALYTLAKPALHALVYLYILGSMVRAAFLAVRRRRAARRDPAATGDAAGPATEPVASLLDTVRRDILDEVARVHAVVAGLASKGPAAAPTPSVPLEVLDEFAALLAKHRPATAATPAAAETAAVCEAPPEG